MQIISYSIEHQKQWDEFVVNSKNGGLFHTQKFLSYHGNKWDDRSILLFKNNDLIGLFAACEVEGNIVSHVGSSAGGLIVLPDNKLADTLEMVEALNDYYKGYSQIMYKKHEYIYDTLPSQEVDFAFQYLGYKIQNIELSTCIDLQNYKISKNRTDKIERGAKKLNVVFDDNNYEDFWAILNANLLDKHNVVPVHSVDEMKLLKSYFPNEVRLVTAYLDNVLVAGIWLFSVNSSVLHMQYISHSKEHNNLYPTSFLFDEVLKLGASENFKYVNFGVSTYSQGKEINGGLFNFKESFGGQGVARFRYSKELV